MILKFIFVHSFKIKSLNYLKFEEKNIFMFDDKKLPIACRVTKSARTRHVSSSTDSLSSSSSSFQSWRYPQVSKITGFCCTSLLNNLRYHNWRFDSICDQICQSTANRFLRLYEEDVFIILTYENVSDINLWFAVYRRCYRR